MRKCIVILLFTLMAGFLSAGGGSEDRGRGEPFHETVAFVDMKRFSGDWYVIALIPTPFEKKAFLGVENYSLDEKGNIRVEYTFRKGSSDGKRKVMYQKGWIYNNETNAEWRVRPLWPLKLPYYVMELDREYTYTVIGTNSYDYLWIMAREPVMDETLLEGIRVRMAERGFDRDEIRMMDQQRE